MSEQHDLAKVSRRQVVMAGSLKWLITASAGGAIGNFTYDRLTRREADADLKDFLPSFARSQLVPGSHHPEERFHPDVYDALCSLSAVLVGSKTPECVDFERLPSPNTSGDLLLLGGPISNELSRQLHGHTMVGKKISPLPDARSGFRWHFYYPEAVPGEPAYSRYVAGRLEPKMRKAIVDSKAPASANTIDSRCNPDGSIANDFLLVTVQPNSLGLGSGTTIIEIADLQGQGDRACAALLQNEAARRELLAKLGSAKYFQALFDVPVLHDSKTASSSPGVPKLVGVSPLGT